MTLRNKHYNWEPYLVGYFQRPLDFRVTLQSFLALLHEIKDFRVLDRHYDNLLLPLDRLN